METVTVRAVAADGRVVLWEQRHDQADVWIVADGRAVTVPLTPAVATALARGVIVPVAAGPLPTHGPISNVETFARSTRKKR
jgi:hypothetical protein